MIKSCNESGSGTSRYINAEDINIAHGYKIELFAEGLNSPSSILFTDNGDLYIADSGYITGMPSISRLIWQTRRHCFWTRWRYVCSGYGNKRCSRPNYFHSLYWRNMENFQGVIYGIHSRTFEKQTEAFNSKKS